MKLHVDDEGESVCQGAFSYPHRRERLPRHKWWQDAATAPHRGGMVTVPVIKAKPLRPGDAVALVSTSSPVDGDHIDRVSAFFAGAGYRVWQAPGLTEGRGYLAGSAELRARGLNMAFSDPSVGLVLPVTGGRGAKQLLPLIDYNAVARSRSLFIGLSDPSVLVNAIVARAGLAALHGPTGFDFATGEAGPFTYEWFSRAVRGELASQTYVEETAVPLGPAKKVRGPVFGGHLGTFVTLLGTPFLPDLDKAVLVLEEIGSGWDWIDERITHLRLAGVFDKVAGVVFGRCVDCSGEGAFDSSFEEMLQRTIGADVPVLSGVRLGHTQEKLSLPLGCLVEVDFQAKAMTFLEDAVVG